MAFYDKQRVDRERMWKSARLRRFRPPLVRAVELFNTPNCYIRIVDIFMDTGLK